MPFRPVFTLKLIALRGGPEWFTEVVKHGRACMRCRWALTRVHFLDFFFWLVGQIFEDSSFLFSFFRVLSVTQHALKRYEGEQPICGLCGTHLKDDEGEYADGPEAEVAARHSVPAGSSVARVREPLCTGYNFELNASVRRASISFNIIGIQYSTKYNYDVDLLNQIHCACCSRRFLPEKAT